MIRMVGKPIDFFNLPDSGLHFIPVPFTEEFDDYYTIGEFTHEDYPALVPPGERVETLAVPTVLAVYNWSPSHSRFPPVERFVERLFENWDKLQEPPSHLKWRDVNLAATVPGWTRFRVAEDMLEQMRDDPEIADAELSQYFHAFLAAERSDAEHTRAERDALFQAFLRWREQSAEATPVGETSQADTVSSDEGPLREPQVREIAPPSESAGVGTGDAQTQSATNEAGEPVEPTRGAQATTNVNMREEPNNNAAVITVVPAGSGVEVFECRRRWCEVTFAGQSGWIYGRFIGETRERPRAN